MAIEKVTPNGPLIERLRKEQAMSLEELEHKSGVSYRTVQKANAGQPIGMPSLKWIAQALGVEYQTLLAETPVAQKLRLMVVIESNLSVSRDEVAALVSLIAKVLPATHEIVIKDVREGSVIIALDMDIEDIRSLVDLFPFLPDAARDYFRTTPEGQAFFRGEENPETEKVRRLLEMIDSVTELRVRGDVPVEEAPPRAPEVEAPKFDFTGWKSTKYETEIRARKRLARTPQVEAELEELRRGYREYFHKADIIPPHPVDEDWP